MSPAVRTLPHPAHRVLVALAAQYSGHGNGSLTLTRSTAALFGAGQTHTLAASLRELEARGLIIQTRFGTRVPPRAAMYALAWWRIDEPLSHDRHEARPTLTPPDTWRSWTTTKRRAHWTTARRAPRCRMCTSVGAACALDDTELSAAGAPEASVRSVPHVHDSHISGQGRRA